MASNFGLERKTLVEAKKPVWKGLGRPVFSGTLDVEMVLGIYRISFQEAQEAAATG